MHQFNALTEQGAYLFKWHPVAKSAFLSAWANPSSSSTGLQVIMKILIFKTGCGLGAPVVKKTMG